MTEHLAPVIDLFKHRITPERRAHMRQRMADLSIQIALLESERERIRNLIEGGDK